MRNPNKLSPWLTKPINNITQEELQSTLESVSSKTIWDQYENSRFCTSSNTNIKQVSKIENTIVDQMPDGFECIRTSPLVPLWIYHILSGMSYDRSIQTSRKLELCSDLSISLALEWLSRRKKHIKNPIQMAGFGTVFRPQSFYWSVSWWDKNKSNYKYWVPSSHFSMYANAILGSEKKEFFFAKKYIPMIIKHYLDIIKKLNESRFILSDIEVEIADMTHSSKILSEKKSSLHTFRDFQLRERAKTGIEPNISDFIELPMQEIHSSDKSLSDENMKNWLWLDLGYLISIWNHLRNIIKDNDTKVNYRIWRSRWAGQYSTLAFSIFAKNVDGKRIDVADGWITSRWNILLNNNTERCLVWWIWTSLIAWLFYEK
jgi:hypothetical protein